VTFGNLLQAIVFGTVGAVVSTMAALLLPETVGRHFAVLESKVRTTKSIKEIATADPVR
jgi:hypothetical protein